MKSVVQDRKLLFYAQSARYTLAFHAKTFTPSLSTTVPTYYQSQDRQKYFLVLSKIAKKYQGIFKCVMFAQKKLGHHAFEDKIRPVFTEKAKKRQTTLYHS